MVFVIVVVIVVAILFEIALVIIVACVFYAIVASKFNTVVEKVCFRWQNETRSNDEDISLQLHWAGRLK